MQKIKNPSIINFEKKGDDRGSLIPIEGLNNIPFEIKRIYYIFDTISDIKRGTHAHINLEQILISVSGSCYVDTYDGKERKTFILDKPFIGLYIKDLVWHEMYNFTSDNVLLVLASNIYNEKDYIRNYEEFLSLAKANN